MRGSPSCEITVGAAGGWRLAVAGVAVAALGATAGWLAGAPQGETVGGRIGAGAVALAILVAAVSLLRHRPLRLRWDGSSWWANFLHGPASAATPGELGVAIDLGSFLLLTFRPQGVPRRSFPRWIPVERTGREGDWHAFRCAVYSPRPGAGSTAANPRLP